MDKNCKGCFHQGFQIGDPFETYGFCTHKNHQTVDFWQEVENNTYKFIRRLTSYTPDKITEETIKDRYLSCLMVQSVYEGECPYKEVMVKLKAIPSEDSQNRNLRVITQELIEKCGINEV